MSNWTFIYGGEKEPEKVTDFFSPLMCGYDWFYSVSVNWDGQVPRQWDNGSNSHSTLSSTCIELRIINKCPPSFLSLFSINGMKRHRMNRNVSNNINPNYSSPPFLHFSYELVILHIPILILNFFLYFYIRLNNVFHLDDFIHNLINFCHLAQF